MKDKAKEILEKYGDGFMMWKDGYEVKMPHLIIESAMLEFARIACEEQKQITIDYLKVIGYCPDKNKIKNVCDER